MELKQYAAILWRWAWLVVLGTALAGATAFGVSWFQQPVYAASATLLVNQAPAAQVSDYTAILTSERLARTYAELLTKRTVLEEVIARLGLDDSPAALAKAVEVQLVRDTQLIELSVEATDPARAAAIANALPAVFIEQNQALQASRYAASKQNLAAELDALNQQIRETQAAAAALGTPGNAPQVAELDRLQSQLTQFRQSYTSLLQSYEAVRLAESQDTSNVLVVEPAVTPTRPVRPNVPTNTALAAAVGLMLAVGVVFLIEYLDDSLRSPDQVTQVLSLPVLGAIPRLAPEQLRNGPVALSEPLSPVTEGYRALRTNIQFYSVDRPLRTILVTSPGPEEGKTTIAANLAVVVAQAGFRVILLDADLRRPSLHTLFHKPNHFGLTDALLRAHAARWDSALQPTAAVRNLSLVTSGALPPNPAELLGSETMSRLLEHLKGQCDLLIVDTPPLGAVTDAAVLAAKVDGVLLVVDAGGTRAGAAAHAREQLGRVGANVFGAILNRVTGAMGGGYYYYYYYYYRSDGAGPSGNGHRGLLGRRRAKPAAEAEPGGAEPEQN